MKRIGVVLVMGLMVLGLVVSPAMAQLGFKTEAGVNLGIIKKLQVKGTTATESNGTGIIDVSTLVPATSSDSVLTIIGDTGTASATSISISTATAGTKTGALKITYTGIDGTATTGWLRIYSSGI